MSKTLDDIRQRAEAATPAPWIDQLGKTSRALGSVPDARFIVFARTDVPRLLAALDAVLAGTYASDDGAEWEHNDGCEGEPTCPACWAQDIRRAINDALEDGK